MKTVILDAYAILGWMNHDKNWQKVEDYLSVAMSGSGLVFMNVINMGEVYYIAVRKRIVPDVEMLWSNFLALPIKRIDTDFNIAQRAARIKSRYPISYADAIATATTIQHNVPLVTGDPDFHHVEHLITVEWM